MDTLVESHHDEENSIENMKQIVHMNGYADVNHEETNETKKEENETKKEECVVVVVRCRPMAPKEISMGYGQVVEMRPDQGTITIRNPKEDHKDPIKTFTFDAVYDWKSKQHELYDEVVRPLVDSVLNGFNATIFAYGQTGTGKTYTMEGCKNNVDYSNPDDDQRGIIPKSFEHIFTHISRTTDKQHLIRASYLEIYQEEVRDLLDKDPKRRYELRESKDIGVYVKGLQSHICKSVAEIEDVMRIGNKNRTIGATNMNEHSSRSHAIFMITIEMSYLNNKSSKTQVKVGKLNLVDLAGSERQSKTGATGDRLKEASKINLSLSALGNVISALVDGKCQHIPYRDSKLTRLLQDSLGGNSRTLMVANIGPASYNYDETLTTLRYANRAKNIQNQPRVNEDPKDALIRQYQEEIEKLKSQLTERKRRSTSTEEERELEERKADILRNDDDISAEEQKRQLDIIEEKQKRLREEKKYSDDLNEKIQSLESKLLQGGKNIIDHTNEQQKALEKHLAEITERKLHDLQMQKKLMELEESAENVRISYTTLLDEVEAKRKYLNKLISKYQRIKQEIQDSIEEHNENRRELELSQKDILKEIKLRQLIIDNFIPPDEKQDITSKIVYDEDEQNWQIISDTDSSYIKHRLLSDERYRRPTSEYAKRNMLTPNLRFRGENVLDLPLYIPEPTTKEYENTNETPSLKLMLESALKKEENIDIYVGNKPVVKSRLPKGTGFVRNGKFYPQARGLVPK